MTQETFDDQVRRIASLSDSTRRSVYTYVVGQGKEVSRDDTSEALGISRALAAFHLDKLAEEGLLETTFRRLREGRGPGAGRPSKLYRRSGIRVEVSLPHTQYAFAARLFVRAIANGGTPDALFRLAGEQGFEIGTEARRRAGARPSKSALMEQAMAVLGEQGFEPVMGANGEILLRNCPFDAAVQESKEIVCGMNLHLMDGLVKGLRLRGVTAKLDPKPGFCCVAIELSEGPLRRSA
jgi:predicted ArsR family transcriptional regulator